ncbi:MAG: hypothetical protein HRT71_09425 [Flavobacteriales bacterium]|nr:hypothetical protein [Flavobacteriales bacterium]
MSIRIIAIVIISLSVIFSSCKSNFEPTEIVNGIYENETLGWKMNVSEGWEIIPHAHRERWTKQGSNKQNTNKLNDGFVHLLGLYKGQDDIWNCMISNMEPKSNLPPQVNDANLINYYAARIKKGMTSIDVKMVDFNAGTQMVAHLTFGRININLIDKNDKVVFRQVIFLKIIGDQVLEVMISYNNEDDKAAMLDMFYNSTFF